MCVQSSTDMLIFGGDCIRNDDGYFVHYWWDSEKYVILNKLKEIKRQCKFKKSINIDNFPKTLFGTYKLQVAIWKIIDLHNSVHHRYLLGAIIYHQLLYNTSLMAIYDLEFEELVKAYDELEYYNNLP